MVQTNLWCGALVALGRDLGAFKLPYAYAQKTLRAYAKDRARLREMEEPRKPVVYERDIVVAGCSGMVAGLETTPLSITP